MNNALEINQRFVGKVFKDIELHSDNESAKINFTDDSQIKIELDYQNMSCHCHPEYEYYLDITAEASVEGE